jgi:hypothetical protein
MSTAWAKEQAQSTSTNAVSASLIVRQSCQQWKQATGVSKLYHITLNHTQTCMTWHVTDAKTYVIWLNKVGEGMRECTLCTSEKHQQKLDIFIQIAERRKLYVLLSHKHITQLGLFQSHNCTPIMHYCHLFVETMANMASSEEIMLSHTKEYCDAFVGSTSLTLF